MTDCTMIVAECESALCLWEAMGERLASECPMAWALVERAGTPAARHDVMSWAAACSADWERTRRLGVELCPFDWEHCPAWLAFRLAIEFPKTWAAIIAAPNGKDSTMQQQIEVSLTFTGEANAAIDAATIGETVKGYFQNELPDDLETDAGSIALHAVGRAMVREEAAIYGHAAAAVPDTPEPGEAAPLGALLARTRQLREAVGGLWALYDRADALNDMQPASLSRCYPASLDEWAANLDAAIHDLSALASAFDQFSDMGFSSEFAGGGCTILSTYRGCAAVWLTCEGGGGYPSPDSWMVGVYPAPGADGAMPEAVWTLSSDTLCEGEAGLARLLDAARAGVATAEALADGQPEGEAR